MYFALADSGALCENPRMNQTTFHIKCIPPKSTHQAALRILKRKDGTQFVGKFATSKGKRTQDELLTLFAPHAPKLPLAGPISVTVRWQYPWRKSESKRNQAKGSLPCDTRPDCDNLAKFVLDIMTRLGFWNDDAQVATLHFTKRWADEPGIWVGVETINGRDET